MIAAATGALVSVIALDETILLNFKQQQDFDYHKIPFVLLGITGFISIYYTEILEELNIFFRD
jgi:CIC family chloride channel protein